MEPFFDISIDDILDYMDMIIPYRYAYFFGVMYLAAIWLFLYWRMPQHRRTMLFFGLSLSWIGVVAEHVWFLKEWWHPQTITGTRIGIEDFIASVTHITIPALLYKYVFGMDSPEIKLDIPVIKTFIWKFIPVFLPILVLLFVWPSFLSVFSPAIFTACLAASTLYMSMKRKDLIVPGIISGILFNFVFFTLYSLGGFFSPGVFEALWDKAVFVGTTVFGVPIEDYIFYFFFGWFGGIAYEYVFSLKLSESERDLEHDLRLIRMDFLARVLAMFKRADRWFHK